MQVVIVRCQGCFLSLVIVTWKSFIHGFNSLFVLKCDRLIIELLFISYVLHDRELFEGFSVD